MTPISTFRRQAEARPDDAALLANGDMWPDGQPRRHRLSVPPYVATAREAALSRLQPDGTDAIAEPANGRYEPRAVACWM